MGRLITIESSLSNSPQSEDITVDYIPELRLNDQFNYEIGVVSASLWYSWKNIRSEEGTNRFTYSVHNVDEDPVWKTIIIPDGAYSLDKLSLFLRDKMIENGDFYVTVEEPTTKRMYIQLAGNESTLRAIWQIDNSNGLKEVEINMDDGKLHTQLLGFNREIIRATKEAPNSLDVENGINSLQIHCSIVKESYVNEKATDIILNVVPEVPPGYQIAIHPNVPIFLPIKTHNITQIRMKITDQTGKLLDLSQEPVSYSLYIRKSED